MSLACHQPCSWKAATYSSHVLYLGVTLRHRYAVVLTGGNAVFHMPGGGTVSSSSVSSLIESSSCHWMSGHSLPGSLVHCQFMRRARSMTISGSYLASAGGCTHFTVAPMAPAAPGWREEN